MIYYFAMRYLIVKLNNFTCYVRQTQNKSGYALSKQRSTIWPVMSFQNLHLKRLQKCLVGTVIIMWHIDFSCGCKN